MADEPSKQRAPARDAASASTRPPAPPRDFIAENLRALFRDADREPLPDALKALLDRLAQDDRA